MNFERFNQLDEIIDSLEPTSEYQPLLADALQGKFSSGAARYLQQRLLAQHQARQHIEKAIALLNSEQPE